VQHPPSVVNRKCNCKKDSKNTVGKTCATMKTDGFKKNDRLSFDVFLQFRLIFKNGLGSFSSFITSA
jgi:hypothetical protein